MDGCGCTENVPYIHKPIKALITIFFKFHFILHSVHFVLPKKDLSLLLADSLKIPAALTSVTFDANRFPARIFSYEMFCNL